VSAAPPASADVAARLAERCGGSVSGGLGDLTVDVPAQRWVQALTVARDDLGLGFFDWLSAVDDLEAGLAVVCHLVVVRPDGGARPKGTLVHLLVRTVVPQQAPVLATATTVFAGAAWHERETWEMFGIEFTGHPNLVPLLLPDGFVGRPLRKDFELAARLARPWPGGKDPVAGRTRR
jgi:NADH-quinone oxidoreductase subunit C